MVCKIPCLKSKKENVLLLHLLQLHLIKKSYELYCGRVQIVVSCQLSEMESCAWMDCYIMFV